MHREMTTFWHNYRAIRKAVRSMPAAERQRHYDLVRCGPLFGPILLVAEAVRSNPQAFVRFKETRHGL